MAQYDVVVTRTVKYAIPIEEAETTEEAEGIALDIVRNYNPMNFYNVLDVEEVKEHVELEGDGSLEHTLNEIADITGQTLSLVEEWARTIDEDRFVSEPIEELANEFADQL
jgi:hypothetical protein